MQESFGVERASLPVARHFWDMLIIDIFEVGHFRNIILKTMISLDHICRAFLISLTVAFAKSILLGSNVSIFTQKDH